jgi:tetratricopeptide (TPR) repeat protein
MIGAAVVAATLFVVLWATLHGGGDEAPWVPAGLAASVVMLVAVAAREVVMRRAWTRYILEQDRRDPHTDKSSARKHSGVSSTHKQRPVDAHGVQLRALQKQSMEADAAGDAPEAHLEAYHSCKDFLSATDETLRSSNLSAESRVTLRAGQERARALQKHHLLIWARGSTKQLTHEAQRRARVWDKIETAQRALDVIETALKFYPNEGELRDSEAAVREFIASVKVSHWVELAERAAFKGYYTRAIDRYRDALFYLSRESMKEEARLETAERISREIELLRARLKTEETPRPTSAPRREKPQGESV